MNWKLGTSFHHKRDSFTLATRHSNHQISEEEAQDRKFAKLAQPGASRARVSAQINSCGSGVTRSNAPTCAAFSSKSKIAMFPSLGASPTSFRHLSPWGPRADWCQICCSKIKLKKKRRRKERKRKLFK